MVEENTKIIINNYKGKRITFELPIDSSINIHCETVIADMLEGIGELKINAKGKDIVMSIEDALTTSFPFSSF